MNDEAVRRQIKALQRADAVAGPRQMVPLHYAEALHLLGSVSFGRIVFTLHALPAIRPVNHILADDEVIIRTHEGAALTSTVGGADARGIVVAYEADAIDPATHLGWSVVVTGYARLVADPAEQEHYRALLHPWVDEAMDCTVRIKPELVTGFRLTDARLPRAGSGTGGR